MKDARLIAERYARAVSQATSDDAELGGVRDDLARLAQLAGEAPELGRALRNPVVPPAQKLAVLEAIAARENARPRTLRLLGVLAEHERLDLLVEVAEALARAADARAGIVAVEVRSAVALDDALRARLQPVLARLAGARVRTREVVDPELLGGLVIKVGGTVYDGSVKTRLDKMRARLVGGGVGAVDAVAG